MTYEYVSINKEDYILKLTLNRPEKLNALNSMLLTEVQKVLEENENDNNVRVVIISGSGRAFCAGADIFEWNEIISNISTHEEYIIPKYTKLCNQVFNMIEFYDKPVIAQIHGYCLGGGLEMALACDIRIAAENAIFGFPEINMGGFPGTGGTQRCPRTIGVGKALELIWCGNLIDGKEAERIGLVNYAVPLDNLEKKTFEIAKQISSKSPLAVSLVKRAVKNGIDQSLKDGIQLESHLSSIVCKSKEMMNGYKTFIEKKKIKS
ncbi:MAG: enoyl-CoA hydratase/isomerase family protein [Nitrososphaeria archaeon]